MAPALSVVRPKMLTEAHTEEESSAEAMLLQGEPLLSYEEDESSFCGSPPTEKSIPNHQKVDIHRTRPTNGMGDETEQRTVGLCATNDGAESKSSDGVLVDPPVQESGVASGLRGLMEGGTTHVEQGFVSRPVTNGNDSSLERGRKTEGNLGRVLTPTKGGMGNYQFPGTEREQTLRGGRDYAHQSSLTRDQVLLVKGSATDSLPRTSIDLGPVSIGLYPSKDPNMEASVVVLPDRMRHKPSFDGSTTSIESMLPQLQLDSSQTDFFRGSSAASLASSSSSAVLSRQSSRLPRRLTPPSTIVGTPRQIQSKHPSAMSEDNTKLLNDSVNSKRRNAPAVYSAIGSLEDPTQLGSYNKKLKGSKKAEQSLKREFPSMVSDTKSHRAASNRRAKAEPRRLIRRTSFEDPSSNPALDASPQSEIDANPGKLPSRTPKDSKARKGRKKELFRPSSDAYTPRIENRKGIKYMPAEMRTPVVAGSMGTLHRPNYSDALRRVAMIIRQHIVKIECRFKEEAPGFEVKANKKEDKLFSKSMEDAFAEDKFIIPRFRCTMVRVPMAVTGMACGMKRIREFYNVPTEAEIYDFASKLFKAVQLSSECSIVSLIYIERLMETAHVPLLASTWRPIFMSGLLMASKVWQDLSTWNVEFSGVYPQYALESINELELQFLRMIKWDLYISSSLYAKYYFALRSLDGKHDFRKRYNHMVGGDSVRHQQARQIEERTRQVKEEALQQLSRSM